MHAFYKEYMILHQLNGYFDSGLITIISMVINTPITRDNILTYLPLLDNALNIYVDILNEDVNCNIFNDHHDLFVNFIKIITDVKNIIIEFNIQSDLINSILTKCKIFYNYFESCKLFACFVHENIIEILRKAYELFIVNNDHVLLIKTIYEEQFLDLNDNYFNCIRGTEYNITNKCIIKLLDTPYNFVKLTRTVKEHIEDQKFVMCEIFTKQMLDILYSLLNNPNNSALHSQLIFIILYLEHFD